MDNLFQLLLTQIQPRQAKPVNRSNREMVRQSDKKRAEMNTFQKETMERVTSKEEQTAADIVQERDVFGGLVDTQEQERIQMEVEKEDFLLSQIDEFREKAKQLQVLLASKESKVQELQSIVNEREDKAQELQNILTERQQEADKIVRVFSRKVDELAECVTSKMDEIEHSISDQVAEVKRASEAQLAANRKLNDDQIAANKKLSEEQLATNKQFLEEQAIANKKLSEGQIAEVKALLENATTQLESIKTDLSEKVHSENVKCYRNIQDLFNEFDSKIEKMDEMERGVGSVKGYVKCLSWFSILNFVVLIGYILYSLGVFNF